MIRAVVVDDEPLARERLRRLLEAEPDVALVAECGDGVAAAVALARHRPDLLFLDVEMPELDGFGLLEAPAAVVFVTRTNWRGDSWPSSSDRVSRNRVLVAADVERDVAASNARTA
jgi:chemotaxis response regulator CheB